MKKIVIWSLLMWFIVIAWCDGERNFMDVDNPNAKDDFMNMIWSDNIPKIKSWGYMPDGLSWTRSNVKWYANKYYEGSMSGYVDKAKEGLSWARETFKWYYNDWVDELNQIVSDKVNQAISWEFSKFKIK